MEKWIIFDADNTLWDIEFLYDKARNEFCEYCAKFGLERGVVAEYQRNRDGELAATYGYSACRFARSFEDTIIYLSKLKATDDDIIHVRRIAISVFEDLPKYSENLEEIFEAVGMKYKIGLLTAGERWVQEKRISEFHLSDKIDKIEIVEAKTPEILEEFCVNNVIDKSQSWMIGDSLRSDISPALSIGLKAIHFRNHNWKEHEHTDDLEPEKFFVVDDLKEILDILET